MSKELGRDIGTFSLFLLPLYRKNKNKKKQGHELTNIVVKQIDQNRKDRSTSYRLSFVTSQMITVSQTLITLTFAS